MRRLNHAVFAMVFTGLVAACSEPPAAPIATSSAAPRVILDNATTRVMLVAVRGRELKVVIDKTRKLTAKASFGSALTGEEAVTDMARRAASGDKLMRDILASMAKQRKGYGTGKVMPSGGVVAADYDYPAEIWGVGSGISVSGGWIAASTDYVGSRASHATNYSFYDMNNGSLGSGSLSSNGYGSCNAIYPAYSTCNVYNFSSNTPMSPPRSCSIRASESTTHSAWWGLYGYLTWGAVNSVSSGLDSSAPLCGDVGGGGGGFGGPGLSCSTEWLEIWDYLSDGSYGVFWSGWADVCYAE